MICERSGLFLDYSARLQALNLWSLTHRRRRGDMIEAFKYFKTPESYNTLRLVKNTQGRTRGHTYKLEKLRSNTNIGSSLFSRRITQDWNNLPESVVGAPSLQCFKSRLDKHWESEDTLFNYRAIY